MSAPLTADSPVFRDGLGDRLPVGDPQGPRLEVLRVSAELQACPAFEPALRDRVAVLASFTDPAFARVHGVGPLAGSPGSLGVLSDRPDGTRMSSLLARAAAGELDTTPRVAVAVLRQLVPAVDALCRHAPGLAHGALAPERLIVAPDGRLVVTDAVFGSALERLNLSRRDLWRGFRVAIPPAAGPVRVDERADVTALGVIALALLLTRPVGDDEYPSRVATRAREVVDLWVLRGRPAPPAVAEWVVSALQINPRNSFATMADALAALTRTPAWQIDEASARCALAAWAAGETVARQARRSQRIRLAATDGVPAPPPPAPAAAPTPAPATMALGFRAGSAGAGARAAAASGRGPYARAASRAARRRAAPAPAAGRSWRWALASAVGVVVLASLALALGWRLPWTAAARTGTLVIGSTPAGAEVLVDGQPRGVTPAEITLEAGLHTVLLRGRGGQATVPVTIVAGERATRRVGLRTAPHPSARAGATGAGPAAAPSGWLDVQAPFDLDLREDDVALGILKSGRIPLSPGRHQIEVVNEALGFSQTCLVQIVVGRPTTLPVEVPFGTVHVNASPWAQVWIDGTPVGDTPLGDLSVPIGPHEFWFRNPQLGEKRYAVSVTLTQPLYLTVDMGSQ